MSAALYIAAASVLLWVYRYQINPDGISYISIAQKYAAGNWREAVNGCWSPLFSWLLVPALTAGAEPVLAAHALQVLLGLVCWPFFSVLLGRVGLRREIETAVWYSFAVLLTSFVFYSISPDILVVVVMLAYLAVITAPRFESGLKACVLAGLIGAAGFLAKAYLLVFFLCHFSLVMLARFFTSADRGDKLVIVRNALAGIAVCVVISGVWIAVLSAKYHRIVVNSAARLVWDVRNSPSMRNPINDIGFITPPNPSAVSVWEDLSGVKVFRAGMERKRFPELAAVRFKVLRDTIGYWRQFSVFSLAALFFVLVWWLSAGADAHPRRIVGSLLFFIGVYTGGYCLINSDYRYFYLCFILVLLCSLIIVNAYWRSWPVPGWMKTTAVISFLGLMLAQPVYSIEHDPHRLRRNYRDALLLGAAGVRGRIASSGGWSRMMYTAFFTDSRFYGLAKPGISGEELVGELRRFSIDYYFYWEKPGEKAPDALDVFEEVGHGLVPGLRVFRINGGYSEE
jgi:hypothetical protein